MNLSLGFDFGTSGARAVVIAPPGTPLIELNYPFSPSTAASPTLWKTALFSLLTKIPRSLRQQLARIAIDGTSATVLLSNSQGNPLVAPLLYNDASGVAVLPKIQTFAPTNHVVVSATSSLTKLLWWQQQGQIPTTEPVYFLHQADWLSFLLHGQLGVSDYHNALKLGYDVEHLCYPDWLFTGIDSQIPASTLHLPQVVPPGTPIAPLTDEIAHTLEIPNTCLVCAGTTDSIAAFLASGARAPGEAVTSLGSTLVIKLLSATKLDQPQFGIYSHRLGDFWLTGGASNTGGAVLRHFFSDSELTHLSQLIDPNQPSSYHYYPLLVPGERFPISDPTLPPQLTPRPENPVAFLQGLLESMARIEAQGYSLLQQFGATPLQRVFTAGGGAQNLVWSQIRARHLGVSVITSPLPSAAFGAGVLAMRGI